MLRSMPARALVALLLMSSAAACGSGDESADPATKTVVVGAAPFSESEIVAHMYAGALENEGYRVSVRKGLGQREIYLPALQEGGANNGIDLVPEYVGTLLEFVNRNAGEASGNVDESVTKLRARLEGMGLVALDPSPAADQNAFAVTKATADRFRLKKLSDLGPVAGQMTLGAGAECPTRPFCQPGLERTYGLKFRAFRALDSGGPRTVEALRSGDIDVGLVFTSSAAVADPNLVVLEDDKKLQTADNIIPAIRADVVDDNIRDVLNRVSDELTTADLIQLNKRADIDKQDPEALAREWLQQHGFTKK
ncbi:MAG TPA: ABC transporter substrate-binding protein [Acidimicrobiales bacterium]|nr:ABC transporter substrate-binding protein [Acidimicrobiales bacterium]